MFENTVAVAGGVGRTVAGAPEVVPEVVPDEPEDPVGALLVVLPVLPVVLDELGELELVEPVAGADGVVEGGVVEAGSLGVAELEPDAVEVAVPGLFCKKEAPVP